MPVNGSIYMYIYTPYIDITQAQFLMYYQVFKHRYSLDCHQRQTHPHQRVTGRIPNVIAVNTPKPLLGGKESGDTDSVSQPNTCTNSIEKKTDIELKAIPEPYSMSSLSTSIELKKQRKRKSVTKDPENPLDGN